MPEINSYKAISKKAFEFASQKVYSIVLIIIVQYFLGIKIDSYNVCRRFSHKILISRRNV